MQRVTFTYNEQNKRENCLMDLNGRKKTGKTVASTTPPAMQRKADSSPGRKRQFSTA